MAEEPPRTSWRDALADRNVRIAFWAGLAAGVVAAYVTRLIDLLAALVPDGLLLAWTHLGPFGLLGSCIALLWLTDLYMWGADTARLNNNSRNPLWAILWGTLGWAYVLLSMLFSPLMLFRSPAEWLSERAVTAWRRRVWPRLGTRSAGVPG
jgi:hypothetical protein